MPKQSSSKKQGLTGSNKAPGKGISSPQNNIFPIVAIGASAGGLEAFEAFFSTMSKDSGLAFVLIAHLDPTHVSLLPELLQKRTSMPVRQVKNGMQVQPNQIYVIPPNHSLGILNGNLQLMPLDKPRGANLPIDTFFRSLAQDQGSNAICIILSGTGSDGTQGLKAIKGEAGMAMVQDEESAKYDGMPKSAIATGLADYVLPPEKMPELLIKYALHKKQTVSAINNPPGATIPPALQQIFLILRTQTEHDFSLYKKNTLFRRIERRMNVLQVDDLNDYAHYLQGSEREVDILFKELLIGVTSFFRDPDAFDLLRDKFLPQLLQDKPDNYTIRVWVAACSSGEEAYSIAIILHECMQQMKRHFSVQIFATDIDEEAISAARTGLYAENIQADVSPERLKHFFTREDNGQYRIRKSIREMLVFAPQNLIKDPPFTKLDLLSCRNLLIYFNSVLQKKLLPVFHYSLKPKGFLFLGPSESIGQGVELFATVEKKWKIFQHQGLGVSAPSILDVRQTPDAFMEIEPTLPDNTRKAEEISALQLVETILQKSNTPPCAIIDDANNIIYIHGRTGHFLEPAEGKISSNILEMVGPGIKSALAAAIHKATKTKQEVVLQNLQIEDANGQICLDLIIKPIIEQYLMRGLMMVIFEQKAKPLPDSSDTSDKPPVKTRQPKTRSAKELENELQRTKENLQTTIEELETSNEELKSTNEELQSTNEELQSTNEEMETSKEELQSLNEESATVNVELQCRIDDLSKTNDDMKNLLDSTEIATLFLDQDLCIRRFTPKATDIIPLSNIDAGRPLKHFSTSLMDTDLSELGRQVLTDLAVIETEVNSVSGAIYKIKVRPYRTLNNVIDGVVITFDNITDRKRAKEKIQLSELRFRTLFELSNDASIVMDVEEQHFSDFNQVAHESLGYTRDEFTALDLSDLEVDKSQEQINSQIEKIISTGSQTYQSQYLCKDGTVTQVAVKANVLSIADKRIILYVWSKG